MTEDRFRSVQINGRKIYNFAETSAEPAPANDCELFIKQIPKNLNEQYLLPHFERFGKIYEFRMMMDFNESNRGYGFVKYMHKVDAKRALEVMKHFFIEQGRILEVQRSFDKCRLFVSNVPKHLSEQELYNEFKAMFPNVQRIITHKRISDKTQNRGFLFLDFGSHDEALLIKKQTTPGRIRKWDRDLKISWANPERNNAANLNEDVKTLFLRNVDVDVKTHELYTLLGNYALRSEVIKISRVREFALVEFCSAEVADRVYSSFGSHVLNGHCINVEKALPSPANSQGEHTNDFDAILRIKCLANYWSVPVIVFGRACLSEDLQYVAVMIKQNEIPTVFFMEIDTKQLHDIQSKACEVVVTLINSFGRLPNANYVIKVKKEKAYIVGFIKNLEDAWFVKAFNISRNLYLYWNEVRDLSISIDGLKFFNSKQLANMFMETLVQDKIFIKSEFAPNRLFGCIDPAYRNKPPLSFNLDNTQIVLCLIHVHGYDNVLFPYEEIAYDLIDTGDEIKSTAIEFGSFNFQTNTLLNQVQHENQLNKFVRFAPAR